MQLSKKDDLEPEDLIQMTQERTIEGGLQNKVVALLRALIAELPPDVAP